MIYNKKEFKEKLNEIYKPSISVFLVLIFISGAAYILVFDILKEPSIFRAIAIACWLIVVINVLVVIFPRYKILWLYAKNQEAMHQYMRKRYVKEIKWASEKDLEDENSRCNKYCDLIEEFEME